MGDVWKFCNITQTFHVKFSFIATPLNKFPLNKLTALLLFMKFLSSCNNTVNNVLYSEHAKLRICCKQIEFLSFYVQYTERCVYFITLSYSFDPNVCWWQAFCGHHCHTCKESPSPRPCIALYSIWSKITRKPNMPNSTKSADIPRGFRCWYLTFRNMKCIYITDSFPLHCKYSSSQLGRPIA